MGMDEEGCTRSVAALLRRDLCLYISEPARANRRQVATHHYRMSSLHTIEAAVQGLLQEAHRSPTRVLGYANRHLLRVDQVTGLQDLPDWFRHGPELSWLLLQGREPRPDGVLVRITPDDQRVRSRDLDNAASNPVLRDAVGLGGAETEAGTAVGTEVEGGGR